MFSCAALFIAQSMISFMVVGGVGSFYGYVAATPWTLACCGCRSRFAMAVFFGHGSRKRYGGGDRIDGRSIVENLNSSAGWRCSACRGDAIDGVGDIASAATAPSPWIFFDELAPMDFP
jgi:hypothetical protein